MNQKTKEKYIKFALRYPNISYYIYRVILWSSNEPEPRMFSTDEKKGYCILGVFAMLLLTIMFLVV